MFYLAYGSNLHPGRMRKRVPTAECRGTIALTGWELKWHKRSHDGSAKCNIMPADDTHAVHFAVWELEKAYLHMLDTAEGLHRGYQHYHLEAPGYGKCLTYRAQESHIDDTLKPYEWYLRYVLQGCEYHGFDGGYIERIRGIDFCADPDAERHANHMAYLTSSK